MNSKPSPENCYHCGEAVPVGALLTATIDGKSQPMCCPGCQAVATLIDSSGLDAFYQLRSGLPPRPESNTGAGRYESYRDLARCKDFVTLAEDGTVTAQLLIGGISCAACTWLIENRLEQLSGVLNANVNLARHALTIQWHVDTLGLDTIFQRVSELGYQPYPFESRRGVELLQREQRLALGQLAVAGVAMMQVGMFAIALHAGELQGIATEYRNLLRWVSLLVATLVVTYSARSFFQNAWRNLRAGNLVMDLPVALAIGLAYAASVWATISEQGQVYFDSVAMFTFFLLLGRFLERRQRHRDLLRQTDLRSLLPADTRRKSTQGWEAVTLGEVEVDDILLLQGGSVVPADGTLVAGSASVDEAAFNGEHFPRQVATGDSLAAGTLLLEGSPQLQVRATGQQTRIARMLQVVNRAQKNKPQLVQLADQLAGGFVAAVLLISTVVAIYWWRVDASRSLWITLSVLVVSCPCALALATPAALASATSYLRQRGLLLTGENCLQGMEQADICLFDKTGTLTIGRLQRLRTQLCSDAAESSCLAIARALEVGSQHPIARAFDDAPPGYTAEDIQVDPGLGVAGTVVGQCYRIGTADFCLALNPLLEQAPEEAGHWIALVSPKHTLAWFELRDTPRTDAGELIEQLGKRGLRCELLTGDNSDQGPQLVAQLGLASGRYGQSPQAKLDYIASLQAQGHRVIMVGDGLNDAPVLAAADCSVAVNEATDLAKSQSDCVLLTRNLLVLLEGLDSAHNCRRIIRQNVAWALGYNMLAVPLAATGFVPPWLAAIGMSFSSLLVVGNSMRLNGNRSPH
jgi:Cu2+-exporting ATPase